MKKLLSFILLISLCTTTLFAAALPVRLKDISRIIEARDNQLVGYGLVVGLRNTGDSKATVFTDVALTNLMRKMGISPGGREFYSRNVAGVMVTATLPPFIKKGQKIPVTVSALGDSTSLLGGTLIVTPLKGVDLRTYALAQGTVIIGGLSASSLQSRYTKNQTTVGRIPDGAIVEEEIAVTFTDQHNITLVLNESNFVNVAKAVQAIQESGFPGAQAIDANTIKVPLEDLESSDLVAAIAELENITLIPDPSAKIVINPRTGTIVIGEMVRLFPVALTHGSVAIKISDGGGGGGLIGGGGGGEPAVSVDETGSRVIYLNPTSTLSSLVNSLNEIGASPKDLISIIQALIEAKALIGELKVM
ncbi:flagellar basal body P-ring protein FlgI [bacterium]|jgi:flagellar P-ring protein FlgI|nr:flagellar basal body P-ring protein FlgI [bacterium]